MDFFKGCCSSCTIVFDGVSHAPSATRQYKSSAVVSEVNTQNGDIQVSLRPSSLSLPDANKNNLFFKITLRL